MAMARLRALLQMRSRAVAAARASRTPLPAPAAPLPFSAPLPARAAPVQRSPPPGLLRDAMAAAGGRSSAAVACAHGRARAAQSYFLQAQRLGGAAAAVARKRLRQAREAAIDAAIFRLQLVLKGEAAPLGESARAWEAAIHRVLLVLFGQSSRMVKTTTRQEIREIIELVLYKVKMTRIYLFILANVAWLFLKRLDDDELALVFDMFGAPSSFSMPADVLHYIVPYDTISTAPEPTCPILDIRVVSLGENHVNECLVAVVSLSARCGGFVLICIGGLVITALIDTYELLEWTFENVADMMKGKTAEEIRKTFNIKNDFTQEEEDVVHKENQWAFE